MPFFRQLRKSCREGWKVLEKKGTKTEKEHEGQRTKRERKGHAFLDRALQLALLDGAASPSRRALVALLGRFSGRQKRVQIVPVQKGATYFVKRRNRASAQCLCIKAKKKARDVFLPYINTWVFFDLISN